MTVPVWTLERPPGIDDLKVYSNRKISHLSYLVKHLQHLECFICREEEDRPSSCAFSQSLKPGTLICQLGNETQKLSRKWVHPCTCKLVAHETCLLSWISTSQIQKADSGGDIQNALRCPQCKARYVIDSDNPVILRIFDSVSRALSRGGKYVALGTVVSIAMGSASGTLLPF